MLKKVVVSKLDDEAKIPEQRTEGAAGYDIFLPRATTIGPGETKKLGSGIALSWTCKYHCGRVSGRSSSRALYNLDVVSGLIDQDYRGEIFIVATNLNTKDAVELPKHCAIAQLVFEQIATPVLIEGELSPTKRGASGFGSTTSVSPKVPRKDECGMIITGEKVPHSLVQNQESAAWLGFHDSYLSDLKAWRSWEDVDYSA